MIQPISKKPVYRILTGLTVLAVGWGCAQKSGPSEETVAAASADGQTQEGVPAVSAKGVEPRIGDGTPNHPMQVGGISEVKLDGDLGEWSKVAAFTMPFMKSKKSGVYMAWNEQGLYGAVQVTTNKRVFVNSEFPWAGDAFELWLDKSFARGKECDPNSTQLDFCPSTDGKNGKGLVIKVDYWGDLEPNPQGIKCVWMKTLQGYTLEFFISADVLKPAKMQIGTKIGMNFALVKDGDPIYQFYHDKNSNEGYRNPSTWGAIVLK